MTITKTFSVNPSNYGIALAVEMKSAQPLNGQLAILSGTHAEEPQGGFFSPHSNVPARTICAAGSDKVERVAIGAKHPVFEAPAAQFAGIDEQYFLSAVLPPAGVPASCRLEAQGEKSGPDPFDQRPAGAHCEQRPPPDKGRAAPSKARAAWDRPRRVGTAQPALRLASGARRLPVESAPRDGEQSKAE